MDEDRWLCCPYCRDEIEDPELVICARCETPHHRECFTEHGKCTIFRCGGQAHDPRRLLWRSAPKVAKKQVAQSALRGLLSGAVCFVIGAGFSVSVLSPVAHHHGHGASIEMHEFQAQDRLEALSRLAEEDAEENAALAGIAR